MLDGIIKTDLNIIKADSGSVFHGLKNTDEGFKEFGEVYFSSIKKNAVKAWKMHKYMTLNLVVPVGSVLFCFVDYKETPHSLDKTLKILMSQDRYFRLTVPPGIWFGFKGIGDGLNLICNVADIVHDPDEVLRKEANEIKIDWSLR